MPSANRVRISPSRVIVELPSSNGQVCAATDTALIATLETAAHTNICRALAQKRMTKLHMVKLTPIDELTHVGYAIAQVCAV